MPELPDRMICPGFINAHTHMYGLLSHGITAEPLMIVFREAARILLLVGMHAAFGFTGLILSAPVTLYLCVFMGIDLCAWQTVRACKKKMRVQETEASA